MGGEWTETTLGEFAPFSYGKGLKKEIRNENGDIPVYGSNGIIAYHDDYLIEDGIIIGRKGSIGNVHYSPGPFWPIDTTFYVESSPKRDTRFVYYLLKSLPLQQMNSDSAVPGLNRDAAHNLRIKVPPLEEQKRIAHILGTLDDKIELNQRMNQTLESMARALFKAWFVDFEPVKAKMNGEPYPLPDEIMSLFPDELVDSELGPIPKGWRVGKLGEIVNVIDCLHSKKPERKESGKPLLQLWNILDNGLIDMSNTYFISEKDYKKWISRIEASSGDCVITNVGRVGAVAQIPSGRKAALGRNMTALRCKSDFQFPTFLIECLLSDFMNVEIYRNIDTGTILDALNVKNIPMLSFTKPTLKLINEFEKISRPVRNQMEINHTEIQELEKISKSISNKIFND